ncbi:MAG: DUF3352 domain-containing protein [Candidatus Aminicenantes bacterium]|nr:DUF3352 domain-containing protein [Candidatus Aminicenantes bacterium]
MKKFLVMVIILTLLLSISCTKKEKDGLSTLIPANTQVYIKIPSLSSLHQNLSITKDSILGKTIPNISFLETGLGFNPLKLEDLQTKGIDVNKSLGFIVSDIEIKSIENKEPDFNAQVMFFLPVTDYNKFNGFIKETFQKIKPEFTVAQIDDRTVVHPDTGKESILFTQKNNYMIATVDSLGTDSTPLLNAILSDKSDLSENSNFQQVASKLNKENNIFFYADMQSIAGNIFPNLVKLTDELPEAQKNQMEKGLEFIKDYLGAGLSVDLENSDFCLESILSLKPESKVLKIMGNVDYNKDLLLGIDKTPLMIFGLAFNFSEYLNLIMGTLPPENQEIFEETTKKIYAQIGLDLEKDIIANMAGSLNFGLFDAENINMTNTNAFISMGIKDETKAANMMNTLIENLPSQQQSLIQKEEVMGTVAYVATAGFFRIFTGIKNNSMFMTIGQPMFETIVSGKHSSGFISKIQDKKLANILSGDYSYFYLNMDELMKAQKNLAYFIGFLSQLGPKINDIASQFEYLLSYSSVEDSSLYGEFIVKTRFDRSFLQGIMNIVDQIKN